MSDDAELTIFPTWTAGRPGYSQKIREAFQEHLERHGLRLTDQRQRILDFLLSAERHLSLNDIYQALRKHGVGRVTVFRTLKMLEEASLVDHVTGTKGTSRFEVKLERPHHDHLICIACGAIQEVRWPELEKIQDKICRAMGFSVAWHRHEVFGRCRQCQVQAPEKSRQGS
ncbi:MAG: transcriptional repressor [Elusimicrobia bacterium]|nr:transcriptional repressor [Elusimicrobiota bacterium]